MSRYTLRQQKLHENHLNYHIQTRGVGPRNTDATVLTAEISIHNVSRNISLVSSTISTYDRQ